MQRQNGKQLIVIGGVVIALVLGIGFLFTRGGSSSGANAATATVPIVYANQTVPAGTTFSATQSLSGFFSVKQIPPALAPFGAYHTVAEISALTHPAGCGPVQSAGCDGQITTIAPISQGLPVVSGDFTSLGQYRQTVGPSFAIPFGYVGIAVNFDAANSVLGAISPGDTIDLIASWRGGLLTGTKFKAPGETQYAMDNLKVISVNAPPSVGGANSSSSSGTTATTAGASGGTVVLLVRYQQALEIQHLKDFGWQLSAVLRSAKATNIPHFRTLPITDKWFFSKSSNPFSTSPGY